MSAEDKAKLDGINPANFATKDELASKVDKETGKGLSENDYTDDDKALVGTIEGKQDTIQDLDEIRSGAALGATAYQKPSSGIPGSDIARLRLNGLPYAGEYTAEVFQASYCTLEELAKAANGTYRTASYSGMSGTSSGFTMILPLAGSVSSVFGTFSYTVRIYNDTTVITVSWQNTGNTVTVTTASIPDVSQFITRSVNDLANYYLKSETFTKAEVQNLIGAIQQFHYEIYASRSEVTSPASNVLYLIGPTGSGTDKYEEYVYDSTKQDPWVKIGDTSIDLSGYVTTQSLNAALANYTTTADLTTLLAGKQDKIDSTHKLDYSFLDNTPTIPDAVEANPTVPAGTTPTDLQNLKVGNDYYAVPEGGDDEAKEVAAAGLCDLDKRIKDILTQVITRSDVRDNLTSPAIAKPLSANQGVVLKKINDDNEEVLAAALCSLYALSAIPAAIAPPYSGSKTYALNDCVTHKTLFWRCTTPVSSPEMFDPNKWTQSSLYEEMLRLLNA